MPAPTSRRWPPTTSGCSDSSTTCCVRPASSPSWQQNVSKPVIAAVNGLCAGGGLHFVADADIVIAASDATFLDPHVCVGQVTAIEMIGLAKKMPFEAVMRMALVGRHERMSAQRAYELGMVSQIVDPPPSFGPRRRRWPRRSRATPRPR